MSIFHWVAVAMLGVLPLASIAGQQTQDPADPRAAGAPFTYGSAFTSYRAASEQQESPDKSWRAVNDMVGKLGGHAGHIAQGKNDSEPAAAPTPDAASPMPTSPGHNAHH